MAAEASSANADPNTTSTTTSAATAIYSSLRDYQFDTDPGFLAGLSQIFGHPGTPVTEAEQSQKPDLVLSAKCFYFSRKFQIPTPIDPAAYKTWLAASVQGTGTSEATTASQTPTTTLSAPASALTSIPTSIPVQTQTPSTEPPKLTSTTTIPTSSAPSIPQPQTSSQTQPEPPPPPYPTSFAAIVELITNNKPIPGIEEIPSTILEPGSSKQDRATRRKKPWEKEDADSAGTEDAGTSMDVGSSDGQRNASATVVDGDAEMNTMNDAAGAQGNGEEGSNDQETHGSTSDTRQQRDRGEGVIRLLRSDAVPDGGLIAKE